MSIIVPVSVGELWDKYSILLIKKEKIKDKDKIKNVTTEIEYLNKLMNKYSYNNSEIFIKLQNVNLTLWEIEDKLRIKEKENIFDNDFIQLARAVYYTNDLRAEIKREINILFNSNIYEVKEYVNYNNK
jgi:hypothetical protein